LIKEYLIIGISGVIFCLDISEIKTPKFVWKTELTNRLDDDFCTLLNYNEDIICGSNGKLFVLDLKSGGIKFSDSLKGFDLGSIWLSTKENQINNESVPIISSLEYTRGILGNLVGN
jgi:hypothetical protein